MRNPLYGAAVEPGARALAEREQPVPPGAGEPGADVFPYVVDDVPADRTPHRGRHVAHRAAPLRAAAGDVLSRSSPALAAERGLENGGWATIVSARGAIEARVMVTERVADYGSPGARRASSACRTTGARKGLVTGDAANELWSISADPNVHIQETKAATCDIRAGRRPRGPALTALVNDYRRRAGLPLEE